jgi:hypothetical protein
VEVSGPIDVYYEYNFNRPPAFIERPGGERPHHGAEVIGTQGQQVSEKTTAMLNFDYARESRPPATSPGSAWPATSAAS